jgi:hypothetical protein
LPTLFKVAKESAADIDGILNSLLVELGQSRRERASSRPLSNLGTPRHYDYRFTLPGPKTAEYRSIAIYLTLVSWWSGLILERRGDEHDGSTAPWAKGSHGKRPPGCVNGSAASSWSSVPSPRTNGAVGASAYHAPHTSGSLTDQRSNDGELFSGRRPRLWEFSAGCRRRAQWRISAMRASF